MGFGKILKKIGKFHPTAVLFKAGPASSIIKGGTLDSLPLNFIQNHPIRQVFDMFGGKKKK